VSARFDPPRSILLPSSCRRSEPAPARCRCVFIFRRGRFMSSQRGFARALSRRGSIMPHVLACIVIFVSAWPRWAAADGKKTTAGTPDVDSEHLFGFTEGSDIGERGEKEFETDSTGRFGRQGGSYAAASTAFEAKYTPLDYFRISG